ncbi:uncharacterized protein Dwil_GK14075 [Drosophila willistoni]|uniref:Odorant receptor n=1 Tax=Drosophila willistoni TaxID=7260 RepID=B4NLB4_DROWI|nr:putative odorant receptor 85e [Drosophila willistoni]EDW84317.1 uncharacterized protein Dwil_GK14075 [Drosophila willistoni]
MASLQFHGGISEDFSYDTELDEPREPHLFRFHMILQLMFGMKPSPKMPKFMPTWAQSVFSVVAKTYCVLVIFSSLHLGVLFTKTTLDALPTGELQRITDALTMTIIYYFTAYSTTYWCVRSRRLHEYLQQINQEYRHHSLAGVSFVNSYAAYNISRNFTVIWIGACLGGVIFWGITPLVLGSHILPLSCWYPFDALAPKTYPWIYATQLYGQVLVGVVFGIGGSLFVTLSLLLLAQFDVLYCSLKNLDAHAMLLSGQNAKFLGALQKKLLLDPSNCELNQYALLKEHPTDLFPLTLAKQRSRPDSALRHGFIQCILLHRFILRCAAELENLFSPYCLVKSLQITLQLCLLVFVGVSGQHDLLGIINQIQYFSLTLFELLMFTYCGELLRRHSVRAGEAYWRGDWWKDAHHIRQDVLIFLINSRRAVQVTAGKFYVMDVNRLRSVITQAFSFLTLLQKLAAKKTETEN